MTEPILTVVIPNYNGIRFLPRLMDSLSSQSEPRIRITIVDDNSPDRDADVIERDYPQVHLIRNPVNLGFAGSCNAGLRAATTPYVALLNNDTHVDPQWAAAALQAFDAASVGAVASLVVLADPPHLIDTAGDVYSIAGGAVKRNHLCPMESAQDLSRTCFSASGASAFFRRAAIEQVGFLDEQFESYYEDVDLGFRLAWAGYDCRFAGDSVCFHHLSSSYSPNGWRYHFNSARNAEVVWWSHLAPALRRRYFLSHLFFLMIQSFNKLRQGCLRPYLAGKWAARRCGEQIKAKRQGNAVQANAQSIDIRQRLRQRWFRLHADASRRRVTREDVSA